MNKIEFGDCREIMRRWAEQGVKAQMCVTSPPYFGLRDYGVDGQLGLEKTPDEYVQNMVEVFRAVRDVLEDYAMVLETLPARSMVRCHRLTEQRIAEILAGKRQPHDVEVAA